MLKDFNKYPHVEEAFFYAFPDIDKQYTRKFIAYLQNLSKNTDDTDAVKLIYIWYKNIHKSKIIGFNLTNQEYDNNKINNIINLISPFYIKENDIKKQKNMLIDIGCGNCHVTNEVCKKLDITPFGLDIDYDIYWGNDKKYKSNKINLYLYDGLHFPTEILNNKFKIAMYNHSLHHFESYQHQIDNFKQISKIIDDNGIIFIKEHDYKINDWLLDLTHLLLFLKYNVNTNIINSTNAASCNINLFKNKFCNGVYLKQEYIIEVMASLNFKLACIQKQKEYFGELNNVNYCFIRQ